MATVTTNASANPMPDVIDAATSMATSQPARPKARTRPLPQRSTRPPDAAFTGAAVSTANASSPPINASEACKESLTSTTETAQLPQNKPKTTKDAARGRYQTWRRLTTFN